MFGMAVLGRGMGFVGLVMVREGGACYGMEIGGVRQCMAWLGKARKLARRCDVWQGQVWQGQVRQGYRHGKEVHGCAGPGVAKEYQDGSIGANLWGFSVFDKKL
jgi:hypothetical protein